MSTTSRSKLASLPSRPVEWSSATFEALRHLVKPAAVGVTDDQLRLAFASLAPVDQNVLTYRLGLDGRTALSVAEVARIAGAGWSSTRMAEGRAQAHLRNAAQREVFKLSHSSRHEQARRLSDELEIDMTTALALVWHGAVSVGQICLLTASQIGSWRYVGPKRLNQIERGLAKRDLRLRQE